MAKVKIETITPVHIGNGVKLQSNFEYLHFANEKVVAPVDEQKVFNIIGKENLDKWLNIIDRKENLLNYLIRRKQSLTPEDVAKRIIPIVAKSSIKSEFIYEHIHNGFALPYIPGSSLKGAIRTAILTQSIKSDKNNFVKSRNNLGKEKYKFNKQTQQKEPFFEFDDKKIQKYFLGSDPNQDIFRFLRTGDAYFNGTCLVVVKIANNLTDKGWEFSVKKQPDVVQQVECIPENTSSLCSISFADELTGEQRYDIEKSIPKLKNYMGKYFEILKNISRSELFEIINKHTLWLLQKEQQFIQKQEQGADGIFDNYYIKLNALIEIAEKCNKNECLLRLGFGSQFNFITGGWQEDNMNPVDYALLKRVPPRQRIPVDLPLPKTRRFTDYGAPLGFVKINLLTEEEYLKLKDILHTTTYKSEQPTSVSAPTAEPPQPPKPVYYTGKLKAGDLVDAELVKIDPFNTKFKTFRLFPAFRIFPGHPL